MQRLLRMMQIGCRYCFRVGTIPTEILVAGYLVITKLVSHKIRLMDHSRNLCNDHFLIHVVLLDILA